MWFVESCGSQMTGITKFANYNMLPPFFIWNSDCLRFSSLGSAAQFLIKFTSSTSWACASFRLVHIKHPSNTIILSVRNNVLYLARWISSDNNYNYLSEIDNKFLQEHGI